MFVCYVATVRDYHPLTVFDETNISSVLAEAATANVHVILADEALTGAADAAMDEGWKESQQKCGKEPKRQRMRGREGKTIKDRGGEE